MSNKVPCATLGDRLGVPVENASTGTVTTCRRLAARLWRDADGYSLWEYRSPGLDRVTDDACQLSASLLRR
jgi:hypothetical protein